MAGEDISAPSPDDVICAHKTRAKIVHPFQIKRLTHKLETIKILYAK